MSDKLATTEEKRVWGIHTKDDNLFLKNDVIALGWQQIGDLSLIAPDRESFKEKYITAFPDAKKGSIPIAVGIVYQLYCSHRFGESAAKELKPSSKAAARSAWKQMEPVWYKTMDEVTIFELQEIVNKTAKEFIENDSYPSDLSD